MLWPAGSGPPPACMRVRPQGRDKRQYKKVGTLLSTFPSKGEAPTSAEHQRERAKHSRPQDPVLWC